MQLDDKELLHQFRQSETKERAFTAIIKKYQEKLYWHIRRMVIDHEDANDVLQNMFIKVWKGLENFKEESLNGSCNWQYNNYRKNKGQYLICAIMMKCPMRK